MRKTLFVVALLAVGVLIGALIFGGNHEKDEEDVEILISEPTPAEIDMREAETDAEFQEELLAEEDYDLSADGRSEYYKNEILGFGSAVTGILSEGVQNLWSITPRISCGNEPVTVGVKKKFLCVVTNPSNGKSFNTLLSVEDIEGLGLSVKFSEN